MPPESFRNRKKEQFDERFADVLKRTGIRDANIVREKVDQRLHLDKPALMNPQYDEVDIAINELFEKNLPIQWVTQHPLLQPKEIQFLERLAGNKKLYFVDTEGNGYDPVGGKCFGKIVNDLPEHVMRMMMRKAEEGLDEEEINQYLDSVDHIHVVVVDENVLGIAFCQGEHGENVFDTTLSSIEHHEDIN